MSKEKNTSENIFETSFNAFVSFFASVKLVLFLLIILAGTSMIGTVIPQNEAYGKYVEIFGPAWAKLFRILDFDAMYSSWWFTLLLALLSLNLIICTFDRLPKVWRLVVMDNLNMAPERLQKMAHTMTGYSQLAPDDAAHAAIDILNRSGWKAQQADKEGGVLLTAQKGAWTRLGVYGVHLSILVIFVGAIIGSTFGFKAGVNIPEGSSAAKVYKYGSGEPVEMGFRLRCDSFTLSRYNSGAPKEYRSDLVVIEDGREVYKKAIVVNDPLTYKGLTFYQSSFEKYNEFVADIENTATNAKQKIRVVPGKQIFLPGTDISFGIVNIRQTGPENFRFTIWFSDNKGEPSQFEMDSGTPVSIERKDAVYSFRLKQFYSTVLQVTKDPGVWFVYSGCALMLLGLYVAFFLSHRRVWVYISKDGNKAKLLISGTSNKNKLGFEKDFTGLAALFSNNVKLNLTKETS